MRSAFVIVLLVLLMVSSITLIFKGINDTLAITADSLVRDYAVRIINDGVKYSLTDKELLLLEKDNNGGISFISINTAEVNRITSNAIDYINDKMAELGYEKITVPMGNLFSSPYTIGQGPDVAIRIMTSGGIVYKLQTAVKEAGINQTLFTMSLKFIAPMTFYSGLIREDIEVETTVPIYEVIIVGDVPETYAKLSDAADFINLIP